MNFAKDLQHPVFRAVGAEADSKGQQAFAIGAFVRDLLSFCAIQPLCLVAHFGSKCQCVLRYHVPVFCDVWLTLPLSWIAIAHRGLWAS